MWDTPLNAHDNLCQTQEFMQKTQDNLSGARQYSINTFDEVEETCPASVVVFAGSGTQL